MKDPLVEFMIARETVLLGEWKFRVIRSWSSLMVAHSLSGGVGSVKTAPSASTPGMQTHEMVEHLLREFQKTLIQCLKKNGRKVDEVCGRMECNPPAYLPFGMHFSLRHLLYLLCQGEEVVMGALVLENLGRHRFTPGKTSEYLERVNEAFHHMIRFFTDSLCDRCMKEISSARGETCRAEAGFHEDSLGFPRQPRRTLSFGSGKERT